MSYIDCSEVRRALGEIIGRDLIENTKNCMKTACLKVENEAKKRCPVGKGTLRASITNTVEAEDKTVKGYVGSNLSYAPYIHQGTGIYALEGNGRKEVPWVYCDEKGEYHSTEGQKPTPFISDAIEGLQSEILQCFKDVFK